MRALVVFLTLVYAVFLLVISLAGPTTASSGTTTLTATVMLGAALVVLADRKLGFLLMLAPVVIMGRGAFHLDASLAVWWVGQIILAVAFYRVWKRHEADEQERARQRHREARIDAFLDAHGET